MPADISISASEPLYLLPANLSMLLPSRIHTCTEPLPAALFASQPLYLAIFDTPNQLFSIEREVRWQKYRMLGVENASEMLQTGHLGRSRASQPLY
jgi:hypothetical protein